MNILIIYATYSSGTGSATEFADSVLKSLGHTVTCMYATDAKSDDIQKYDLTILASPSWLNDNKEGMPHQYMTMFMNSCQGKTFENKKFAVFGLGDTSYAHFCGAVDHMEKFVKDMKGILVVDSLRIDSFYFNQEVNEKILKDWLEKLANTNS